MFWTGQDAIASKGSFSLESVLGEGLHQHSREYVEVIKSVAAQGITPILITHINKVIARISHQKMKD